MEILCKFDEIFITKLVGSVHGGVAVVLPGFATTWGPFH